MNKNSLRILGLIVLTTLALQSRAMAHAFLDHAEPRVGSTIDKSPHEIRLWFTQQPEHAFSVIEVFNSEGKAVDRNDTHTDSNDAKELVVSVLELPPGTYKVVWHVLSVDTHRTQGDFRFTIK